jgi:hypothetical protein
VSSVDKMDEEEIAEALNDYSDMSDGFDDVDSGSEYVPSDHSSINIFGDSEMVSSSEEEIDTVFSVATSNDVRTNVSNVWGECKYTVRQFPFIGKAGLQQQFDKTNPIDVYKQFLNDDILYLIVEETNRYAHQVLASGQLPKRSMMRRWHDTDETEIKTMLGILMIMGVSPVPQMRLYWSKNPLYEKEMIKKAMHRERFEMLLKCIHFHNNEDIVIEETKLGKISNLINRLNDIFQNVLMPDESVVIDETMVPFRGRLSIRQYLPGKSHKYGVKLYKVCSPSGYTFKIKVYAGKSDVTPKVGHAQHVVTCLMTGLLNDGRILYADNFYNSVRLAEYLLEHQTYMCGTLLSNRKGNPKELCDAKVKKGEVVAKENGNNVKIIKWKDKRSVLMISTRAEDAANLIPTGKRNRKGEEIRKPSAIIGYNAAKKGVDFSDQMSTYYSPLRKSVKWYRKVALEVLLGTCVVNAFVIFNEFGNTPKKIDMLAFREAIIGSLLGQSTLPKQIPRRSGRQRSLKQPHHQLVRKEGSVRTTRKRCLSCYEKLSLQFGAKTARMRAKRVATFCTDCENQPPMCLNCFNERHT